MFKILKNLNRKERIFLLISLVLIVMQVWLELKIPDYMSNITMLVQTEGSLMKDILYQGMFMLICALIALVINVSRGYFAAYIGSSFEKNLRKKIFKKVGSFSLEEIKSFSTSSLITRSTNDITQVKTLLIMGIQVALRAPITAVMAIIKILGKEWTFSLITFIGVGVIIVSNVIVTIIVVPKFKKIQTLTDNINRVTRENLTGLKVIRAYNAEDYQLNKFDDVNNALTNNHLFVGRVLSFIGPLMSSIMQYLSLAIYFTGAYLINAANITDKLNIFSDMVVFSSYAVQVIMSFMMLVMTFIIYPRASVSIKRINEVLDTFSKIKDGDYDKPSKIKGSIEFNNVSFKYPDAEESILENISFKVNPGETIAIIGGTGSGKTTLINLIPRFYDVTEGSVLIDGINVKDMKLNYLYDKIGYISQKAILFKGTIESNISFGKNISKKEINNSLKIAQADFVNDLDGKENALVSQAGSNLSGGQKQRISIARAIARKPEILIFDDSFSALDYKTDYKLRKELESSTKGITKFIVAQRIGTIKEADKILVLDEGKLVGIGKHDELLKTCEVYKEIALSQLSEEELA